MTSLTVRRLPPTKRRLQHLHLYNWRPLRRPYFITSFEPQKKHFFTISMKIFAKIRISWYYKDFILLFVQPAKKADSWHKSYVELTLPEDFVTESILYDQQAKITTPISRIHVDDHILVPGNDTDMAHGLQTTLYRALVHAITAGKLGKGLLAVNIFWLQTLIVKTIATDELPATTAAFVKLAWAFATVFLDIRRGAIIADFYSCCFKWCKDNKYQRVTALPSLLFAY